MALYGSNLRIRRDINSEDTSHRVMPARPEVPPAEGAGRRARRRPAVGGGAPPRCVQTRCRDTATHGTCGSPPGVGQPLADTCIFPGSTAILRPMPEQNYRTNPEQNDA